MQSKTTTAYVSLGSNLGDPQRNLERARSALAALEGGQLGTCSQVYDTEPQDVRDQPWFVNQVVRLNCGPTWTAWKLLRALLEIEDQMGRKRDQDKGPRIIDLDLLLFGAETHHSPGLILPHPRLGQRAFVLVPLKDIAPGLVFPNGQSIDVVLNAISFQVHGRTIHQQ